MREKVNQTACQVVPISLGMVKVFLIKGEKAILVDTGMPGDPAPLFAALRRHLVEPKDLSLIVITHGHADHAGQAASIGKITGAPVAIHRLEAVRLAEGKTAEASPVTRLGALVARIIGSPPIEPVQADILIDDLFDLRPFGVAGKLIHTPGHTVGSMTVCLDNGEMVAGDLFNGKSGWHRFPGRAGRPFFAYNLDQLAASLRKIASLAPRIIYNAHGVPVDADAVVKLAKSLERR